MATIYLALGSNLGDRLANLQMAITALAPHASVTAQSPVYETPPWGYLDQPAFLNQALQAETILGPEELLVFLKQIEARLGRLATVLNGPRPIDLDILFYDDLVLETPRLSLPHPRLPGRAFALLPLVDLAPDLRHPVLNKTIRQMLQECDCSGITRYPSQDPA
jgi:2-amino-4-hydroxy-6-hydroxymethyldihydropteridine diphosphokinase